MGARLRSIGVIAGCVGAGSTAVVVSSVHERAHRTSARPSRQPGAVRASLARQPLSFIENRGRVDGRVAYYADGGATSLFFTRDGVTVALSRGHARGRGWALRQLSIGGRPRASPQATRPAPGVFNSFVGPRSRWRTGVKSYRSVTYRHVWPGIDVVYSGQPGGLEYGLVIKPGADPRSIRLAYRGATALRVTHAGRLEVSTPAGDFT